MGFLDHEGGAEFPYHIEEVFDALMEAAKNLGMKVDQADKASGHILLKEGVSLMSWGENIPISLSRVTPARTRVSMVSTPKTGLLFGGAFDLGKNRRNIEGILAELAKVLRQLPPAQDSGSLADLAALADLRDRGVVSEEELQARKRAVLDGVKPREIKPLPEPSRRPGSAFLGALFDLSEKRKRGEIDDEQFAAAKAHLIAERGKNLSAT